MSSRELQERDGEGERANQASNEVQFALVIARMIETVKSDPELMRRAVYDLARQKLHEQLVDSNPTDSRHAKRALETAIRGVEEFSRQQIDLADPSPVPQLGSALPSYLLPRNGGSGPSELDAEAIHPVVRTDRWLFWTVMTRTPLVLLVVGIGFTAVLQRERLMTWGQFLR